MTDLLSRGRSWTTLGAIVSELESGGRPAGGASLSCDGVLSIGGEHVAADGALLLADKCYVPRDYYDGMQRGKLQRNDILIVKDGATTGKVGFVDSALRLPAAVNEHVFRLKVNEADAFPRYVFYCLLSPRGNREILFDFRGATVGGISRDFPERVRIPVPGILVQQQIAGMLDKADRLRRMRRYALELSDQFLPALFLRMFGERLKHPGRRQLGDLVTISGGGTPARDRPEYYTGRIPWLTSKDMTGDYIWDTEEHITNEAVAESATKRVPAGSVLVVVKSKVLAHSLPVAIAGVPMCHGQDIKSIQCGDGLQSEFLRFLLKYHTPRLLRVARGANTEGLSLPMLNELPVPDVSDAEQRSFVAQVSMVEQTRALHREALRQAEHLFQSLLNRYFGEAN